MGVWLVLLQKSANQPASLGPRGSGRTKVRQVTCRLWVYGLLQNKSPPLSQQALGLEAATKQKSAIPPASRGPRGSGKTKVRHYRQILYIPAACRMELTRTASMNQGAIHLMTIVKSFLALKVAPSASASSMMASGLMTKPTKMQVTMATTGIRTLLEIKSMKSRICMPRIFTSESGP